MEPPLRGGGSLALAMTLALACLATSRAQDSAGNPIDDYFTAYWKEHGITPARLSDDHEFLRRASLDVLGRMPRPEEVRAFEKSPDRTKKIDELLASDEAAEFFTDTWLRLLLDYRFEETAPLKVSFPAFRGYLRHVYRDDVPYADFATELLSETGDSTKKPATNYALAALDPKEPPYELASRSARIFLGVQIQCARCHDHPTDRISREDFWGLTALFSGVKARARTTFDGYGVKVTDEPVTTMKIPDSETVVAARFLDGTKPDSPETARRTLARCVVSSPQFPRTIVNRVWAELMGRGFVEPLDGFTEKSEPTHPRLLEALARDFTKNGTSLRWLLRTILSSRTYQLSSETVAGAPPEAHACMILKPQNPVQMLNTLTYTLDLDVFLKQFYKTFYDNKALPESYRNDAVFRMYLIGFVQKLLAPGGRAPEESGYTGSVRLALKLMNAKDLQGLVRVEWGRLAAIAKAEKTPGGRLTEIFYTLLGRPPTDAEKTQYLSYIEKKHGKKEAYEDIYWVLLNSTELFFNH
jgi:hypothetical protein